MRGCDGTGMYPAKLALVCELRGYQRVYVSAAASHDEDQARPNIGVVLRVHIRYGTYVENLLALFVQPGACMFDCYSQYLLHLAAHECALCLRMAGFPLAACSKQPES